MPASTHPRTAPALPYLVPRGFSPTVDLVFRTLGVHGPRSVVALARDLGLPVRQVSDALDALRSEQLVGESAAGSAGRTWSAADPVRAVGLLNARGRRTHTPPPVDPSLLRAPERLGPGILHLPTRGASRERMAALGNLSRHEHLTFNPEPRFEESSMRAAAESDRRLIERGIAQRIIGVQPHDPSLLAPYGIDSNRSATYREATHVPTKLFVLDRRVALFPVDPGDYERGYLEISQAPIVEALVRMFEAQWDAAVPPAETGLSLQPREAAMVALLASGCTDAVAAQRLRISERSVSNILRALMDRLGVQNRFQLGIVLGARGAINPSSPNPIPPPH